MNTGHIKYIVLLLRLSLISIVLLPSYTHGTNWSNENYTHYAKEEPLHEMLKIMAADQNISIIVSNKITDNISAYFRNKKASDIFSIIKRTYNLATYFDGDSLYVYKNDELQTTTIVLTKSPIIFLEKELISDGGLNKETKKEIKWNINKKKNAVTFRGSPRLIYLANKIATRLNRNEYIYKWRGKNQLVHYSNEPPFGDIKFLKIMSISPKVAQKNITPLAVTTLKKDSLKIATHRTGPAE